MRRIRRSRRASTGSNLERLHHIPGWSGETVVQRALRDESVLVAIRPISFLHQKFELTLRPLRFRRLAEKRGLFLSACVAFCVC
jgi:hypothetical protein